MNRTGTTAWRRKDVGAVKPITAAEVSSCTDANMMGSRRGSRFGDTIDIVGGLAVVVLMASEVGDDRRENCSEVNLRRMRTITIPFMPRLPILTRILFGFSSVLKGYQASIEIGRSQEISTHSGGIGDLMLLCICSAMHVY